MTAGLNSIMDGLESLSRASNGLLLLWGCCPMERTTAYPEYVPPSWFGSWQVRSANQVSVVLRSHVRLKLSCSGQTDPLHNELALRGNPPSVQQHEDPWQGRAGRPPSPGATHPPWSTSCRRTKRTIGFTATNGHLRTLGSGLLSEPNQLAAAYVCVYGACVSVCLWPYTSCSWQMHSSFNIQQRV